MYKFDITFACQPDRSKQYAYEHYKLMTVLKNEVFVSNILNSQN